MKKHVIAVLLREELRQNGFDANEGFSSQVSSHKVAVEEIKLMHVEAVKVQTWMTYIIHVAALHGFEIPRP